MLQFHSNLSRNSLKLIILCGFGLSPTNTQRGSTKIIRSQYQALTTSGDSIQQCKSTTTEILSQESDPGFIFPKRIFKLLCNTIPIKTASILNARCLTFKPGTSQVSYTMSSIQKKSTQRMVLLIRLLAHTQILHLTDFIPQLQTKEKFKLLSHTY